MTVCPDCEGVRTEITCLNCSGSGIDPPYPPLESYQTEPPSLSPEVRASLEASMAGLGQSVTDADQAVLRAQSWRRYTWAAWKYYREWLDTGQVPAWDFPSYDPDGK